jgi:lysozyme
MSAELLDTLKRHLNRDEGRRYKAYFDSQGHFTLGVGHNIEDVAVSDRVIDLILDDDIAQVLSDMTLVFNDVWKAWPDNVKLAVLNMMFNLGVTRFCRFTKMIGFLRIGDFERAALEATRSLWAYQVGDRAVRVSELMIGNNTYK